MSKTENKELTWDEFFRMMEEFHSVTDREGVRKAIKSQFNPPTRK